MGVGLWKKPKDLSGSEREERGHEKGVGVYCYSDVVKHVYIIYVYVIVFQSSDWLYTISK